MNANRLYLDYNATSPLRPEARDAMLDALDRFGNPSSIHGEGRAARALVEEAREKIAARFSVTPAAVSFNSGGTEAANWLLQGQGARGLCVLATEHSCVLHGHRSAAKDVAVIPVSNGGVVAFSALEQALVPGAFVAVQAANNETGVVQPLAAVRAMTEAKHAFLVCDAVQAIGRIPTGDLTPADALFLSAHKFGGPKGVGAAVMRRDLGLQPLIRGGGQESRQRSGTENVAAIAGLSAALDAALGEQSEFSARAKGLRDRLEAGLRAMFPDAVIFGEGSARLPNTTCFAIPGMSAEMLLIALDLDGVAVSSGAACSSGKVERSHVLAAMGVSGGLAAGAIRVSTGWQTAEADIERFLTGLGKICGARRERRAA